MVPTDQGLGAGQDASFNLGLIVEEELIVLDPLPEPFFHLCAGPDGGLLCRREEASGVASRLLGLKHGDFGPLQGVARAFGLASKNINTEARWAMVFVALKPKWFSKDSKYFFSDDPRAGCGVVEIFA